MASHHKGEHPWARAAGKAAHVKLAAQSRPHDCHWPGCGKQVPPAMWGCSEHWYRLPKAIRDRIWRSYRPGQEDWPVDGKIRPSANYLAAAKAAQDWIAANHPPLPPAA